MLRSTTAPLARAYDLAMLDLDGVVYVGDDAVPGAADGIAAARSAGMKVAFITNNASRPPRTVVEHLRRVEVDASEEDVVTSAQAAARVAATRFGPGARVVCLGGEGLRQALLALDLVPVAASEDAQAVVTGYGPDVRWREIMEVAVRVGRGLPWIASNTDHSIPTPEGIAPGHGVLVDTIARFTGVAPAVAGKPETPLLAETVRRLQGETPLMVGDRLDTDIEGAHRFGCDSLLVLTGVTGLEELVAAAPAQRPTYLSADLDGLTRVHPPVAATADGTGWEAGAWTADVEHGRLRLWRGDGPRDHQDDDRDDVQGGDEGGDGGRGDRVDPTDAWRAAASAAWAHHDATGRVPDTAGLAVPDPRPGAR